MIEKWLVYKGTGGLIHNFGGMFYALNIARLHNRKVVIDNNGHGAFGVKFEDYFVFKNSLNNIYFDYNEIPVNYTFKGLGIEDIKGRWTFEDGKHKIKGKGLLTNRDNINEFKEENLVVFINWAPVNCIDFGVIKVSENINQRLKYEPKITEKYISVHFRNTDMKNDINHFLKIINGVINMDKQVETIYLASDDNKAYDKIKECFKEKNVIRYTVPPLNIKNLHYTADNKEKQMYECLRDIYMILKSDYFIPSRNSGISLAVIKMVNDRKFLFSDIDETKLPYII